MNEITESETETETEREYVNNNENEEIDTSEIDTQVDVEEMQIYEGTKSQGENQRKKSRDEVDRMRHEIQESGLFVAPQTRDKGDDSMRAFNIEPILYSFKVPQDSDLRSIMTANLPSYWQYQDHAFGVIWLLFCKKKKYIGISQLHWCLRFLLELKDNDGLYAEDVSICIQTIQDILIEQYANLGNALKYTIKSTKEDVNDQNKIEAIRVNDNSFQLSNFESRVSKKDSEIYEDAKENIDEEQDTLESVKKKEEGDQQIKKSVDDTSDGKFAKSLKGKQFIKGDYAKQGGEKIISKESTSNLISLTYNEMMSRGSFPYTEQINDSAFYKDDITLTEVQEIEHTDFPKQSVTEVNKKSLVEFLNVLRQQHVQTIKKEILKLYNLEKFMENIIQQNFNAYITDDLAKRLDNLEARDLFKL